MHGRGGRSMADRVMEENRIVVVGNRVQSRLLTDQTAPGDFTASDCAAEIRGSGRESGR